MERWDLWIICFSTRLVFRKGTLYAVPPRRVITVGKSRFTATSHRNSTTENGQMTAPTAEQTVVFGPRAKTLPVVIHRDVRIVSILNVLPTVVTYGGAL